MIKWGKTTTTTTTKLCVGKVEVAFTIFECSYESNKKRYGTIFNQLHFLCMEHLAVPNYLSV